VIVALIAVALLIMVTAALAFVVRYAGRHLPGTGAPGDRVPDDDVPDMMRRMIQDRHDARDAAVAAAEAAANLPLPPTVRRNIAERAAAVGAAVEIVDAGEVRIVVGLTEADGAAGS
jgi:Na+(H+)/acetate symporter ActP